MPHRRTAAHLCALLAIASLTCALPTSVAEAVKSTAHACSRFAAPYGSDATRGTKRRPFKTAQRLAASLRPGQTGCLRGGSYSTTDDFIVRLEHGGTRGRRITLQSFPGEQATLKGNIEVIEGSNDVTLTKLRIVGTGNSNTVKIYSRDVILEHNDITNAWRGRSCLILGSDSYGVAVRPIIRRNRFHECGSLANGNQDHAVYAQSVVNGQITGNIFWDMAAYAIQLYPNAQRTRVAYNIIDGGPPSVRGGVLFGGESGEASRGNVVTRNVIAYAAGYNIAADWHDLVGRENVATRNCLWDGGEGNIDSSEGGFRRHANVVANPMFRNRQTRDYRLKFTSRCKRVVGVDPAARLPLP
jgi:Right handed beta helix region